MTQIPSSVRLHHGRKIEDQFFNAIQNRANWKCKQLGQFLCNEEVRVDLRNANINSNSELAKQLISMLPDYWQHVYKRGIGKKMPSLSRWDADAFCIYNNEPQFFAEIKSSITRSDNVSIEISCYLAALVNRFRLGLPQYFFFSPNEDQPQWTYLQLDQIPELVSRVLDGNYANGSSTPFALIPKNKLCQTLDQLLDQHEIDWLL